MLRSGTIEVLASISQKKVGPVCDVISKTGIVLASSYLNTNSVWVDGKASAHLPRAPWRKGEVLDSGDILIGFVGGKRNRGPITLSDSDENTLGYVLNMESAGVGKVVDRHQKPLGHIVCYSSSILPRPSRATYRWPGLDLADINIASAGALRVWSKLIK